MYIYSHFFSFYSLHPSLSNGSSSKHISSRDCGEHVAIQKLMSFSNCHFGFLWEQISVEIFKAFSAVCPLTLSRNTGSNNT